MLLPTRLLRHRTPTTLLSLLLSSLTCILLFTTTIATATPDPQPRSPTTSPPALENDDDTPTDPSTTTPITGYAYCASSDGGGACRYVAGSVSGYDACNILERHGGSLDVYKGTSCVLFADEECGGNEKGTVEGEGRASKVIDGQGKVEDLAGVKLGKGGVGSFRCGFSEGD